MTVNFNVRKALLVAADVVLAVYLVLAMTAFRKPADSSEVCRSLRITLNDCSRAGCLGSADIEQLLRRANLFPVGRRLTDISVADMEAWLNNVLYIKKAEVYKTHGGDVCISLVQRVPVVRVMSAGGDYYVDSEGFIMPSDVYISNLVVATGAISREYASKVLARIANHIMLDKFWKNQTEQLNVLPDGSIELVPRVGSHIVCLGRPSGVAEKLERTRLFYKHGLSKIGWNKYSCISVEFANQIVCRK